MCSTDSKMLGKSVLSGKNKNILTCVLIFGSCMKAVLNAVLLAKWLADQVT